MYLKLFALLLCIAYVACEEYEAPAELCINTTDHSTNVRMHVSDCDDPERCPLYRGTNHTVTFIFEPTMPFMNRTDFRVYGVFEKFSVPYGKKGDACQLAAATDDGADCSSLGGFWANREYKHTSRFAVSNNYPLLKLKVRFVFYDRRSKLALMCRELPVEIMSPPTEENETR